NAPRERDRLFDIVRWELPKTVRRRAARSPALILRSAHAQALPQSRTSVRASRRMRTATAVVMGAGSPSLSRGSARATAGSVLRTTLGLWETIASFAPLFPDCYLQWMPQLQRVEPSARAYIAPRSRSTSSAIRWPSIAAGIPQ